MSDVTIDDCELLAVAIGWKYIEPFGTSSGPMYGKLPAGGGYWEHEHRGEVRADCPNPAINANDTIAVINWFHGIGYRVRVDWRQSPNGRFVEIWKDGTTNWKFGHYYDAIARDDWMEAVCQLVLKLVSASEHPESKGDKI